MVACIAYVVCVCMCMFVECEHTAQICQIIPNEMSHIARQIAVHKRARGIHYKVDVMDHLAQIQWIKPKK